ncbi:hypothetical protein K3495_g4614 [Podosphaera aphanis]|nr:hypothetical protein K3495_g4614 [Podosphaera aphanis]
MSAKCLISNRRGPWCLADSYDFIALFLSQSYSRALHVACSKQRRHIRHSPPDPSSRSFQGTCKASKSKSRPVQYQQRSFHDYFLTNLPSSSLHPDSRSSSGPHHKFPRSASIPHTAGTNVSPAAAPPMRETSRELTVVRISLQSAKHHFGAAQSRGTRLFNEDTYQAGTLEIPAFAKRAPISLSRGAKSLNGADSASGDPQVFYFGVFDGHGGDECSTFLRDNLHMYLERSASLFEMKSSLLKNNLPGSLFVNPSSDGGNKGDDAVKIQERKEKNVRSSLQERTVLKPESPPILDKMLDSTSEEVDIEIGTEVQNAMVKEWREAVGGYFRRFKPGFSNSPNQPTLMESILMHAFLRADLDFISAQAQKPSNTENRVFGKPMSLGPWTHQIGGPNRFIGGSTGSIALISTPTPTPFWHPDSPSTMLIAHVGDTRIILCDTATGLAKPCTTNHHPSSPSESSRLRRYAATFVMDSFGEEHMSGLANTRSFGDMHHKRIGVSAEPEIHRIELAPAEYSMLVLVSDGVSRTLSDQEIVDVIKEAKTPDQGACDVVSFATEVSRNGDNATCLVVRLGGWERRGEGGLGSLGTKERRDWRSGDAGDMRKADGLW